MLSSALKSAFSYIAGSAQEGSANRRSESWRLHCQALVRCILVVSHSTGNVVVIIQSS